MKFQFCLVGCTPVFVSDYPAKSCCRHTSCVGVCGAPCVLRDAVVFLPNLSSPIFSVSLFQRSTVVVSRNPFVCLVLVTVERTHTDTSWLCCSKSSNPRFRTLSLMLVLFALCS